MTAIIIPRRHYAQPRGRVQIDHQNPLTLGMRSALLLNGSNEQDLIDTRATLSLIGGAAQEIGGVRLSSTGQCIRLSNALAGYSGGGTVLLRIAEYGAAQPFNAQMMWGDGSSVYCQHNSPTSTTFSWGSGSGVTTEDTRGRTNLSMAFVSEAGGAVYFDRAMYPRAGGATLGAAAKTIQIGLWQANVSFQFFGVIAASAFVDRRLSAEEITQWVINPWQIFRADPIRIYSLPTGAISINSITASNITQTGARITLGVTR